MKIVTGWKPAVALLAASLMGWSCGKKDSSETAAEPPEASSGALALEYAVKALSSSQSAPSSTALVASLSGVSTRNAEVQSTKVPDCSNKGAPWNRTTNTRMDAGDAGYAERAFYCQTNVTEAPDTIIGTLAQSQNILCSLESEIGSIEYTAEGKVYENVRINPTTACGWDESDGDEIPDDLTGKITAKSYATGDWRRSLTMNLDHPQIKMEITVYVTATDSKLAVKFVEGWNAALRDDSADAGVPADATGTRGAVISVDRSGGIMRAEYGDTYWGRRSRLFAKGTFDSDTGKFSAITDVSSGFTDLGANGGRYISAKGTTADGIKYYSVELSLNGALSTAAPTAQTPENICVPSSGCSGNDGFTYDGSVAQLKFMSIGGAHDAYNSTRAAYQTWLSGAGDLTFNEFSTDVTL